MNVADKSDAITITKKSVFPGYGRMTDIKEKRYMKNRVRSVRIEPLLMNV